MPNLTLVWEPFREFFTLARAERTARGYAPSQAGAVKAALVAGDRRLAAARSAMDTVPACELLRDAVICYLNAQALAGGADGAFSTHELPATMSELPPDLARGGADRTDDDRIRAALNSLDPLYFDRLAVVDAGHTRSALDRAASMLRRSVEARSPAHLWATRWGRTLAVVVVVIYGTFRFAHGLLAPQNVALHKPVTPSSVWYTPAGDQNIVDGDTGTSFGIHTQMEESPNVVIDLIDLYPIDHIDVHNRVDAWFDDCLPLAVDLSSNGKDFHEIALRTTHFEGSPPWTVDAHRELARYVRVRVARKSYLALSEVEVFAKKNKKK